MTYVDGFVLPIPKDKIAAYTQLASAAGKIWIELGALQYFECIGDDLEAQSGDDQEVHKLTSFPKLAKASQEETVVFAWIVYASKEHRDEVNAKVMVDPRIAAMGEPKLFDSSKMAYGGFKTIVELQGKTDGKLQK